MRMLLFLLVASHVCFSSDLNLVDARLLGSFQSPSIAVDAQGNTYFAGLGSITVTHGALKASGTAFLVKRNPEGVVLWATYISEGHVASIRVAVDAAGDPYLAGATYDPAFPVTPNAFQKSLKGVRMEDAFVMKLSASGAAVQYSTLLGSDRPDTVTGIAVTPDGSAVVTGFTGSYSTFPLTSPPEAGFATGGYVARLNHDGSALIYARPLRGTTASIATDAGGNVLVGGQSSAADHGVPGFRKDSFDSDLWISRDGGSAWERAGNPYITTDIALHPTNPNIILRATYTGLLRSIDAGLTWTSVERIPSEVIWAAWFHPKKAGLAFAASNGSLYRSDNGGADWEIVQSAQPFRSFFAAGETVLGITSSRYLYSSEDDGRTWQARSIKARDGVLTVQFDGRAAYCATDPVDPQRFLVGSASTTSSNAGIAETRDGGKSFVLVSGEMVTPLAIDPRNRDVIYGRPIASGSYGGIQVGYLLFSSPFVKSEDGGKRWRLPKSGQRIQTQQVYVDPAVAGRVYAIGALGIYRSDDSGEDWEQVAHGTSGISLSGGSIRFGQNEQFYLLAQRESDGYVAKLDGEGRFIFSTLVGGSGYDAVTSVAVTGAGEVLAAGTTRSDDLLRGSLTDWGRLLRGLQDGFMARLSADGLQVLGVRSIGGDGVDTVLAISELEDGHVLLAGTTGSKELGVQGPSDGLLAVISPGLDATRSLTVVGGEELDRFSAVAVSGTRAFLLGFFRSTRLGDTPLICEATSSTCDTLLAVVELAAGPIVRENAADSPQRFRHGR